MTTRPSSALLSLLCTLCCVFCELQVGRRLEVGTAPRSELLFELLLVREPDKNDGDQ